MNIKLHIQSVKTRINDKELIAIKKLIDDEIDRRLENDKNNASKK